MKEKGRCRNIKVMRNDSGFAIAKWCNRCYDYLDINSFEWDDSREGYLLSWCKSCNLDIGKVKNGKK